MFTTSFFLLVLLIVVATVLAVKLLHEIHCLILLTFERNYYRKLLKETN